MIATDATRLAGDAYCTRLAQSENTISEDKTRLAQEGYQSKLARDAAVTQPDTNEFYKVGEKIGGRYEVRRIHHGALGVVYGCFDHQTNLPRALKTVRARHASDEQVIALFEREAAVWVSLEKHPYIVRAYLVDYFKGAYFVIAEYVRGSDGMLENLTGWLGHPRLTLPVAVTMALQIAQGMQHAVRKVPNLVHRDLKPANILVNGDGKAMVTDFGLVHSMQSGAGTPAYMSPEQWRAEALDARSDIYAYGCILFEMFTAHGLFPALTEHEWERAHLERAPVALTSIAPQLPDEIDQFVRRCLAKDPLVRPQSWDEAVTFFAQWYHRLTGNSVVMDFSSLALDAGELLDAGRSLWYLGRDEEAVQACDRALSFDSENVSALNFKAYLLRDLERYEEEIETYDRWLAIAQNNTDVWRRKGKVLGNLKRCDEAIQAYDFALAIESNSYIGWAEKGKALHRFKREEDAIVAFDNALTIDPIASDAWREKGFALFNLKRYQEAIQALDRALFIEPADLFGRRIRRMAAKAVSDEGLSSAPMIIRASWCPSTAGLDEETYRAAEPHFDALLTAFQEAGRTLKDLFKFLIEKHGIGVKDYALRFAKERKLTADLEAAPSAKS